MYEQIEKWFIFSDIHSFKRELIKGLKKSGFDINNPTHGIIVIGDIFDRGKEALAVYDFIQQIPRTRRILIKGNHELCYKQLLNKTFPSNADFMNGTVHTFFQIAKMDYNKYCVDPDMEYYFKAIFDYDMDRCRAIWNKVLERVKASEITKFILSDEWVNYYELDNKFILTHCFIPAQRIPYIGKIDYCFDWRNATAKQWEVAMWGDPISDYRDGIFDNEAKQGKILVCGHWFTGDFYRWLDHKINKTDNIYYGQNIIAIDGGVFLKRNKMYHKQNVLVIDVKNKTYGDTKKVFNY